jgi:AmmeMemoRadiSam system protein B
VAGRFYPAEPRALAELVDRLLAAALPEPAVTGPAGAGSAGLMALIAPHAGYQYSGPVAAAAYAHLAARRADVARVVVLGPAHYVPLTGMAVPAVDAFATPLGPLKVDADARERVVALDDVTVDDEPHAPEHSLETQLPFLQRALGPTVQVLPVLVGDTPPDAVARLLSAVAGPGTVAVVSTDLSHYLDLSAAHERDARTARAVVDRAERALGPDDACGYFPLRGLLRFADERDLAVRLLRLATSADAGSDPRRVVGYGSFLVSDR